MAAWERLVTIKRKAPCLIRREPAEFRDIGRGPRCRDVDATGHHYATDFQFAEEALPATSEYQRSGLVLKRGAAAPSNAVRTL
jgi:hypothetical protein